MRPYARPFRGFLLVIAFLFGGAAVAQELQFNAKALDTTGAASSVTGKRAKGKKGADGAAAPESQGGDGKAGGPNRQFGELEGWSPGKAPPKSKDKRDDSAPATAKPPVSVTPSGNMGTGFAF